MNTKLIFNVLFGIIIGYLMGVFVGKYGYGRCPHNVVCVKYVTHGKYIDVTGKVAGVMFKKDW